MQKTLLFLCFSLALLIAARVEAQCKLNPVIKPDNLILCPNAADTLYTTEAYDTYQWYRENKAIPGATSRYFQVKQYDDAGYHFKVAVTKGNCKDTSKKVLVDGWVFASPIIASSPSPRYVNFYGTGYYCAKDSLVLSFLSPTTINIQWYNNYEPIKGANEVAYHVTGTGAYTVCGTPPVCPNFVTCENIPVDVVFDTAKAIVSRNGDTLIAGKAKAYQWSLNGEKIPSAASQSYIAKKRGVYRVMVWDKIGCADVSKPVVYAGLGKEMVIASPNPAASFINVHIVAAEAVQIVISDVYGTKRLQLPVSSINQRIAVGTMNAGTYLLQVIDKNNNVIATTKFLKQ